MIHPENIQQIEDAKLSDSERVAYVTGTVRRIMRNPQRRRVGAVARNEIEAALERDSATKTLSMLDSVLNAAILARMVKVTNGLFWLLFVGLALTGCDSTTITNGTRPIDATAGAAGSWTASGIGGSTGLVKWTTRVPEMSTVAGAAGAVVVPSVAGAAGAPAAEQGGSLVTVAGAAGAVVVPSAAGAAGAPAVGQGGSLVTVAGAAGAAGLPSAAGAAGAPSGGASTSATLCPYCDEVTCGGCAFRRASGARYVVCDVLISCG